jgi:multisubunit Na+/H+ antiporter MnhB subunit
VRLGSVDVALTEAAIGAGIGGVLLLGAAMRLEGRHAADPGDTAAPWQTRAIAALSALFAAGLAAALLALPEPAPSLAAEAVARLPATDLGNPVTAVLMVWRGLDTLLEAIVVLLAVIGIWSLAPDAAWGGRPGPVQPAQKDGPLLLLARVLPPIGIVIGLHVVWAGADGPGGKFQGGAILAAMWVLAWMAGLVRPPAVTDRRVALALVAGPVAFLAVGFAGLVLADGFLALPPGLAKPLILAVEAPLTLSIAAGLALLLLGPPQRVAR